jgi:hypothetical protein
MSEWGRGELHVYVYSCTYNRREQEYSTQISYAVKEKFY